MGEVLVMASCQHCIYLRERECRRHAPRIVVLPDDERRDAAIAIWPEVHESDWCGEYKPRHLTDEEAANV